MMRFDIVFYTIINCNTVKERVESVEADTIEAAKKNRMQKDGRQIPSRIERGHIQGRHGF